MRTLGAVIFLVLVTATLAFSQIPKHVDTLDYYVFVTMQNLETSCDIDGEIYPKELCDRIVSTLSNYNHRDSDNITLEDIRFTRYRLPNGTIEHTQYEVDPEIAPFGEYINYYPGGQVKSKWYFQEPNSSLSNEGVMEGVWLYFNTTGDTIGSKRFHNGLAHGKWTIILSDTTWVVKEFKNGFSEGLWTVHRIEGGHEMSRPYAYHNGFYHSTYVCNESFETYLDMDEHIFQKEGILEVDSIEYADNRQYIKNGKFFVLRDGIRIAVKEFSDGELVENIKFDYR
jgi:hypothetical protein